MWQEFACQWNEVDKMPEAAMHPAPQVPVIGTGMCSAAGAGDRAQERSWHSGETHQHLAGPLFGWDLQQEGQEETPACGLRLQQDK